MPFMNQRRGIIGLSFVACSALACIALYQVGILKKLPQPRSRFFNTRKIHASSEARIFGVPDAFLGLASYSVTASLAAMGSADRWRKQPQLPVLMSGKLLADAALAGKLTFDEATKFRCFSVWSLVTAACTFAALPLACSELKAAVSSRS